MSVDDGEGSAAWGNANDRMLDYAESGDLCVTFAAVDDGSDRSRATADLITKVTTANLTIHQITTADQLDDLVI